MIERERSVHYAMNKGSIVSSQREHVSKLANSALRLQMAQYMLDRVFLNQTS